MTPILKGTAARLGLRKPEPPLRWYVEVDMSALRRQLVLPQVDGGQLHAAFEEFRRQISQVMKPRVEVKPVWDRTENRP